jgi:hypothetical protein
LAALIYVNLGKGIGGKGMARSAGLYRRTRVNVILKMADELQDISKLKVGIYTVLRFVILK